MVKKSPQDWLYGYQQAMEYMIKNSPNHLTYFTPFYGQPYIYYLFFTQYSPQKYQQQANLVTTSVDTGTINKIDDLKFETPNFNYLQLQSRPVLGIFSYDDAVRQGIDLKKLIPLSPINNTSTFYAYQNP